MEQDLKLPEYPSLQGNPSENWRRWIQRFELYLVCEEMTKKPDPTNIAMLLSAVGPEALERYNYFEWHEGENKNKFNHVKAKFEKEFAGQKRFIFSSYQFWDFSKTAGKTFDEFFTQLRTLALSYVFTEPDNMIRERKVYSRRKILRLKSDCFVNRSAESC